MSKLWVMVCCLSATNASAGFDPANCSSWSIDTVGGGNNGDGGSALLSHVISPFGLFVAVGANDAVFVSDTAQNRIRKAIIGGNISTVAGNGALSGPPGDLGPATAATIHAPAGLAGDAFATFLFVAEAGGNRIRRVNLSSGIISTVAGNGTAGYNGDGQAASGALLFMPLCVVLHPLSGVLALCDSLNNRVRQVVDGAIQTIVGTGFAAVTGTGGPGALASIALPSSLVWDAAGVALYIAEAAGNIVRGWNASSDAMFLVAGNGHINIILPALPPQSYVPATSIPITAPVGLVLSATNLLYIVYLYSISAVNLSSRLLTTVAGNGNITTTDQALAPRDAAMYLAWSAAFSSRGQMVLAHAQQNCVRLLDLDEFGVATSSAIIVGPASDNVPPGAIGLGGPATAAMLPSPVSVFWEDGALIVTDSYLQRVLRVDDTDGVLTSIAGSGGYGVSADGSLAGMSTFSNPAGLWSDGVGGYLVADTLNHVIRRIFKNGTVATVAGSGSYTFGVGAAVGDGLPALQAAIALPSAVALDLPNMRLLIAQQSGIVRAVQVLPTLGSGSTSSPGFDWAAGNVSTLAGNGWPDETTDGSALTTGIGLLNAVVPLHISGDEAVVFSGTTAVRQQSRANMVQTLVYSVLGPLGTAKTPPSGQSEYNFVPWGLAADANGNLFVADVVDGLVYLVAGAGNATTVSALNGLNPVVIAGGGSPLPDLSAVSGMSMKSFCGDGGPATNACLQHPRGLAAAPDGSAVWIADWLNGRIRKIWCSDPTLALAHAGEGSNASASAPGVNSSRGAIGASTLQVPSCPSGQFHDTSASCAACPPASSAWDIFRPLLALAGVVLCLVLAACAFVLAAAWVCGGTIQGGLARVAELVAWTITLVQILAQVGQAASAGLPQFVGPVYAGAAYFQFASAAVPSACIAWLRPFSTEIGVFSVVLLLSATAALYVWRVTAAHTARLHRHHRRPQQPHLQQMHWALLVLVSFLGALYSRTAYLALSLVHCVAAGVAQAALGGLDGGGGVLAAAPGGGSVSVLLLAEQPTYICYSGSHAAAGALAWVVLVAFVVGFPVAAVVFVSCADPRLAPRALRCLLAHDARGIAAAAAAAAAVSPGEILPSSPVTAAIVGTTYAPAAFYLAQLDHLLLFSLAAVAVFWPSPVAVPSAVGKGATLSACLVAAASVLIVHPAAYPAKARWRLYVRVYALALALAAAWCNAAHDVARVRGDHTTGDDTAATTALSALVVAGSLGFLALVLAVLCYTTIHGASLEHLRAAAALMRGGGAVSASTAAASGGELRSLPRLVSLLRDFWPGRLLSHPWPLLPVEPAASSDLTPSTTSAVSKDRFAVSALPRDSAAPRRPSQTTAALPRRDSVAGSTVGALGARRIVRKVVASSSSFGSGNESDLPLRHRGSGINAKVLSSLIAGGKGAASDEALVLHSLQSQVHRLGELGGKLWEHAPTLNPMLDPATAASPMTTAHRSLVSGAAAAVADEQRGRPVVRLSATRAAPSSAQSLWQVRRPTLRATPQAASTVGLIRRGAAVL